MFIQPGRCALTHMLSCLRDLLMPGNEPRLSLMLCLTADPRQGNRTYQLSHLVKPTDIVYPDVWTQPGHAATGLWMPSFWVRVSFGITDLDAKNLVQLLEARPGVTPIAFWLSLLFPSWQTGPIFANPGPAGAAGIFRPRTAAHWSHDVCTGDPTRALHSGAP